MITTTQLHPKRCETCIKTECLFNPNAEEDWKSFAPESIWVFTKELGCASHIGNTDDLISAIRQEEEEKRIRQDERDKVLNEVFERYMEKREEQLWASFHVLLGSDLEEILESLSAKGDIGAIPPKGIKDLKV